MADARAEIAKLEALHAEHPQGRIFTHLAEAYRKAGELERAREVLTEGIDRHPEYSSAHVVLARVLMDMGQEEDAASEFERVLELDGHNLVALRSLGDMARTAGRPDEAARYYRRLLEVEPSDDDVLRILERMEEEPGSGAAVAGLEAEDELQDDFGDEAADEAADELPMLEDTPEYEATVEEEEEEGEEEEEPFPWSTEPAGTGLPGPDADADEPWTTGGGAEEAEEDVAWEAGAAEEPVEEELEEPLPPLPPETGEPGVMTETIAQVYARQGLYEQAAEVYRQLVRNRPDDPGLRTRLAEMEALAATPAPGTEDAAAAGASVLDDGTGLPGLEEESDLPGLEEEDEEGPAVAPLPGLQTTELDETPDVAPLAGLETDEVDPETGLRPVEAGTGAVEGIPEETVRDVPAPPEEEPGWTDEEVGGDLDAAEPPEPWAADLDDAELEDVEGEEEPLRPPAWASQGEDEPVGAEPWSPAEIDDGEGRDEPWEPWSEPDAEGEGAADTTADVAGAGPGALPELGGGGEPLEPEWPEEQEEQEEPEQVESVWTGADGASGAEESPYAWADGEPEAAADESEPIGSYLRALLGWPGSGTTGEGAGRGPGRGPGQGHEQGQGEGQGQGEASAGTGGQEGGGERGRTPGDDDLDTFRSWLESLKQ